MDILSHDSIALKIRAMKLIYVLYMSGGKNNFITIKSLSTITADCLERLCYIYYMVILWYYRLILCLLRNYVIRHSVTHRSNIRDMWILASHCRRVCILVCYDKALLPVYKIIEKLGLWVCSKERKRILDVRGNGMNIITVSGTWNFICQPCKCF